MLKIDLHIHTISSGHAFSTINEIINIAKKKKMKVIGISDHGHRLNHTYTNPIYFKTLERIPKYVNGLRVLKGVEANIIDSDGNIDVDEKMQKKLDYIMAAFHHGTPYKDSGIEKNTKTIILAMKKKKFKVMTHLYDDYHSPIDVEEAVKEACKNNILLEVNLAAFSKRHFRENKKYFDNLKKMITIVKKYNKKVLVNSDAHWIDEVGDDSVLTKKLKKEIGLTDDLIINNYPRELEKFLGVKF